MALTLTEGELYSSTTMVRNVIDRLVKDSVVLKKLPFITVLGNSFTYDTITTDSTAAFYSVGDTWTESTPSVTQATASIVVLGKDADINNFLLQTRSNHIDLKGTVMDNAVKAVQYKFLDTFFYGSTSVDSKSFNGLHALLTSTTYNTVHEGSTSTEGALNISNLRAAIDLITGYKPDVIIMSKQLRRGVAKYLDSIGSAFPRGVSSWGETVDVFDGIPIIADDHIADVETVSSSAYGTNTGGGATSLFILSFGEQAACGLNGGKGIETIPLGDLETKDAQRYRIRWYCGLMLQDLRSCAKIDGIDVDGTVAA